jgi:hypothetical protein
MPNTPERSFSFKPDHNKPVPLTEMINGEQKIIAYCTSEKMAKELILRLVEVDSHRLELNVILESHFSADEIREHIKNHLSDSPKFWKEKKWL